MNFSVLDKGWLFHTSPTLLLAYALLDTHCLPCWAQSVTINIHKLLALCVQGAEIKPGEWASPRVSRLAGETDVR